MALNLKNIFSSFKKTVRSTPKRVVGIDVGSSAIKVVEIEQTQKALTLRTYGELQLGPYAEKGMGEAITLEPQKLTEALVDVVRESNVKAKDGVLAIPLSSSFVTVIPITVKEEENIDSKIRVEARKYIPVPLSDVTLDWSELHTYGDKDAKVHEILLAAIQNEAFERYQKLMGSVSMVSQPSEIEVFSAIRGVFRPADTSLAVIDLGAETSKLYITKDGALERIHRVYDGGATCTKRLSHLLSVSFEDAENMKRTYSRGTDHARDIYKAYISTIERSTQEFKRVIEQYEARLGEPIGRIVITGGAASFPGVELYMSDLLNREVVKAQPFSKVAYPAFMEDTLDEIGISFATALGAALRPFEMIE
ncbi:type IV pilus assembly protein PilM [Candidatus Pacebacteria bacterium]|nr:type IV pilus assembly protein PilM [Candidatus Paceibacterota bacterium]